MGLFKTKETALATPKINLAELALNSIHDGVMILAENGVIQLINPAAVTMTECHSAENALGLDFGLILHLEDAEGNAMVLSLEQPFETDKLFISTSSKRVPIALTVLVVDGERILVFRDITKERAESDAQMEFISTASHEMRTPIASIEGYLGLVLNPQTATIDERARNYIENAHNASRHLGRLFQDLLDTTKMSDERVRANLRPMDLNQEVQKIAQDFVMMAQEKPVQLLFDSPAARNEKLLSPIVYANVDPDFLREIVANLVENAIKYTPANGSVAVNVRGEENRAIISVSDTGIGISPNDLPHIFQKFYRIDNSDTRTIGGTGLGLYLVKARVEAMGGLVWAESVVGRGSTFFVSLPRITSEEFEKYQTAWQNQVKPKKEAQ